MAITILLTHAIAKALLFMSVGAIILTTNSQDLTELGGLSRKMPATTVAYITAGLGMVGIFPLGCFWGYNLGIEFFWQSQPALVIVFLLVNLLTALNLTRVFRLVFLGPAQPKSRRAPEVAWPMAVPMVTLVGVTLLVPLGMHQMDLLPPWRYINVTAFVLLIASGVAGVAIGATVPLSQALARSTQRPLRILQDLLAYDFYTEKLYRLTVVWLVARLSFASSWFDRYIVDGVVNSIGLASLMGGESLKYSISGRSQGYILTIMFGVGLLVLLTTWTMW